MKRGTISLLILAGFAGCADDTREMVPFPGARYERADTEFIYHDCVDGGWWFDGCIEDINAYDEEGWVQYLFIHRKDDWDYHAHVVFSTADEASFYSPQAYVPDSSSADYVIPEEGEPPKGLQGGSPDAAWGYLAEWSAELFIDDEQVVVEDRLVITDCGGWNMCPPFHIEGCAIETMTTWTYVGEVDDKVNRD